MTHVVQFTSVSQFIDDLTGGEPAAVYYDLIEQRVGLNAIGVSRWILATIIRAIVANGDVTHVAAVTISHGQAVERYAGRIFGPPSAEAAEPARLRAAREQHDLVIDYLRGRLGNYGLVNLAREGLLAVPSDLQLVLAVNPLDELIDQLAGEAGADYAPGGDGSEE